MRFENVVVLFVFVEDTFRANFVRDLIARATRR